MDDLLRILETILPIRKLDRSGGTRVLALIERD
jgi:hypothetical protein